MGVADQCGSDASHCSWGKIACLVLICCQSTMYACSGGSLALLLLLLVERKSWRDLGCSVSLLCPGIAQCNHRETQCFLVPSSAERDVKAKHTVRALQLAKLQSWFVWIPWRTLGGMSLGGESRWEILALAAQCTRKSGHCLHLLMVRFGSAFCNHPAPRKKLMAVAALQSKLAAVWAGCCLLQEINGSWELVLLVKLLLKSWLLGTHW